MSSQICLHIDLVDNNIMIDSIKYGAIKRTKPSISTDQWIISSSNKSFGDVYFVEPKQECMKNVVIVYYG